MEIAILAKNSLRIKGKHASLVVDPQEKTMANAALVLNRSLDQLNIQEEAVVIDGPGEYEIGGVKMSGMRNEGEILYDLNVDGVEILLGKLTSLEKQQHKLKEQNIVVAYVDSIAPSSFITSLASNVVIFYGEHAKEVASTFGKGNVVAMQKYSGTVEKLPQEVETIILE